MAIYFAWAAGHASFYDDLIGAPPEGALEITAESHMELLAAQGGGAAIVLQADGTPSIRWPAPPSAAELLAAERETMRASRFQARAALHMAGLLDDVEAAVAQADPIVQIAWADAAEWRRDSPALIALAGAVGLGDEDIDALFRQAMQIVA